MKQKIDNDDIKSFNESDIGKIKNAYLKRSMIIGVILIIFGLCYIILNVYFDAKTFDYIISITVLLFGIYFVINSTLIKRKEIIKFINSKKTSKK